MLIRLLVIGFSLEIFRILFYLSLLNLEKIGILEMSLGFFGFVGFGILLRY